MVALSQIRGILSKSTLEVIPHVYQLTIRVVNLILIAEEELTLIDAGFRGSSARIIDFVHQLGRSVEEVSLIIVTHSHFDHSGGLAELRALTGAKVAAHRADIFDTNDELPYPGGRSINKLLRIRPFSALRRHLALEASEVDIQLEGGEVLQPLGGLRVIYTPGHTPGSISLYSPKNKLLIVGDALVKRHKAPQLPLKMVSTNRAQAIDSVKEMAQLDFDILCFGHGRPLTNGARTKLLELIGKIGG